MINISGQPVILNEDYFAPPEKPSSSIQSLAQRNFPPPPTSTRVLSAMEIQSFRADKQESREGWITVTPELFAQPTRRQHVQQIISEHPSLTNNHEAIEKLTQEFIKQNPQSHSEELDQKVQEFLNHKVTKEIDNLIKSSPLTLSRFLPIPYNSEKYSIPDHRQTHVLYDQIQQLHSIYSLDELCRSFAQSFTFFDSNDIRPVITILYLIAQLSSEYSDVFSNIHEKDLSSLFELFLQDHPDISRMSREEIVSSFQECLKKGKEAEYNKLLDVCLLQERKGRNSADLNISGINFHTPHFVASLTREFHHQYVEAVRSMRQLNRGSSQTVFTSLFKLIRTQEARYFNKIIHFAYRLDKRSSNDMPYLLEELLNANNNSTKDTYLKYINSIIQTFNNDSSLFELIYRFLNSEDIFEQAKYFPDIVSIIRELNEEVHQDSDHLLNQLLNLREKFVQKKYFKNIITLVDHEINLAISRSVSVQPANNSQFDIRQRAKEVLAIKTTIAQGLAPYMQGQKTEKEKNERTPLSHEIDKLRFNELTTEEIDRVACWAYIDTAVQGYITSQMQLQQTDLINTFIREAIKAAEEDEEARLTYSDVHKILRVNMVFVMTHFEASRIFSMLKQELPIDLPVSIADEVLDDNLQQAFLHNFFAAYQDPIPPQKHTPSESDQALSIAELPITERYHPEFLRQITEDLEFLQDYIDNLEERYRVFPEDLKRYLVDQEVVELSENGTIVPIVPNL